MARSFIHSPDLCGWRLPWYHRDAAAMDTSLDRALIALAAGQDGMLTTAQAHRAGLDKDSLWGAVRHGELLQVDGKVKFASGDPDVLWAEKRREDQLRAMGYTVVRITWAGLETRGKVAAKVRRAMLAAAA